MTFIIPHSPDKAIITTMSSPLSPPNAQLAAELEQVAADATLLLDYLEDANDLSPPFPKEEFQEIAESLTFLMEGTSRGAAMLLWYASKRLPSLRREHLRYEALAREEKPAYQVRGMSLDRRLVALIASVGTALDECRAQDSIEDDAEPEAEVRLSRNRIATKADSIGRGSRKLSRDAGNAAQELAAIKEPSSERADELSRGLADLQRLGQIAATELSFHTIVWNWLQKIGTRIADYPSWLENSGRAIQKGADIAEVTWLRWEHLWHQIAGLVIKEARETGHDIEQMARKWQEMSEPHSSEHSGSPAVSVTEETTKSELEDVNRRVRVKLAQAANDAKSSRLRAIKELIENNLDHPETVLTLAERAVSDPSTKVQQASVAPLLTQTGEEIRRPVIRELIRRYGDDPKGAASDVIVRFFAKYPPCAEGSDDQFEFLLRLVESGAGQSVYPYAMQGLLNHFGDRPQVMLEAERIIKNTDDRRVVFITLGTLTKIHSKSPHTQAILTWALSECEDRDLKIRALRLVSKKPEWSKWTLPLMLELRKTHRDQRIKREASRSLKAIGWADSDAEHQGALLEDDIAEWLRE